MGMKFEDAAPRDLMYWTRENRKNADRIYRLIKDIQRNGADNGIGMPERLKHIPAWSRRIDQTNRMIYDITDGELRIISCRGHYED